MRIIKYLWGEINLRCFLTVLLENKPVHFIEFRPRESNILLLNHKKDQDQKYNGTVLIEKQTRLSFYHQTPFFFHYIEGLSLFIPKQISTARNRHCQIKWNTATVTDRVPVYLSWKVCICTRLRTTRLQRLGTPAQVKEHGRRSFIYSADS